MLGASTAPHLKDVFHSPYHFQGLENDHKLCKKKSLPRHLCHALVGYDEVIDRAQ